MCRGIPWYQLKLLETPVETSHIPYEWSQKCLNPQVPMVSGGYFIWTGGWMSSKKGGSVFGSLFKLPKPSSRDLSKQWLTFTWWFQILAYNCSSWDDGLAHVSTHSRMVCGAHLTTSPYPGATGQKLAAMIHRSLDMIYTLDPSPHKKLIQIVLLHQATGFDKNLLAPDQTSYPLAMTNSLLLEMAQSK